MTFSNEQIRHMASTLCCEVLKWETCNLGFHTGVFLWGEGNMGSWAHIQRV